LEEIIWTMHFSGVRDILALTGDAPIYARRVYDLDSVSLVQMLKDMNHGLKDTRGKGVELRKTEFDIGVAVNPFKFSEAELMPQYYKLWKKIQAGAQYIIPQLGYDARKVDELHKIMKAWDMKIPVFGNVFLLNKGTARWFHKGNVPGVLISDELLEITQDKDIDYFVEFAAKQMAIEVGLGAKGIHLGGTYSVEKIIKIIELYKSYGKDDWKYFVKDINYSLPGQFFLFEEDEYGINTNEFNPDYIEGLKDSLPFSHRINSFVHTMLFTGAGFNMMKNIYTWLEKHPKLDSIAHVSERVIKTIMYGCRDCGDCTLPEREYLCVMDDCAKGLRNGPCGGSIYDKCEVIPSMDCLFVKEYKLRKTQDTREGMMKQPVIVGNPRLDGTSGWANYFMGRDHATAKEIIDGGLALKED